jgi:hypothetical protein
LNDDGLRQLGQLPLLTQLDLRDTAVTDAGLTALRHYHSLTELDLRGSKVTEKGIAALRKALPHCKIVH